MIADFYIFYIKVSLLITIAVVAAPFLVVGIRGFKTQRPFLISLRWVSRAVLVFSVSLFLAAVIFCFSVFSSPPSLSTSLSALVFSVCSLPITVCSLLSVWMKGYTAFGATYAPFREALIVTLEELQLSYEEPFSIRRPTSFLSKRHIKLTSVETDVQISVWIGAVHIAVKQDEHYPLLTEISDGMNQYFHAASVRPSMIPFALYLLAAVGILTAVVASGISLYPRII